MTPKLENLEAKTLSNLFGRLAAATATLKRAKEELEDIITERKDYEDAIEYHTDAKDELADLMARKARGEEVDPDEIENAEADIKEYADAIAHHKNRLERLVARQSIAAGIEDALCDATVAGDYLNGKDNYL